MKFIFNDSLSADSNLFKSEEKLNPIILSSNLIYEKSIRLASSLSEADYDAVLNKYLTGGPDEKKDVLNDEFPKMDDDQKEDFLKKIAKAKVYSPRLPSVFLSQLNKKEYAAFQEIQRKFIGFYIQKRSLRDYQVAFGANVFGFITQVNDKIIQKNKYYNSGDLIGRQGVEEAYEEILRGVKGVKYILKDYKGAIEDYTKAIELNRNFVDAYYNRGNTYYRIRRNNEACLDLKKTAELGKPYVYDLIKEYCK